MASRLRHTAYTCTCMYILFGFQLGIQFFTIHVADRRVWFYSPAICTMAISP